MSSGPMGNNARMTDHDKQVRRDEERLHELDEEIEAVRHRTPEYRAANEPHYVDSGSVRPDLDDQTIVPPG